MSVERIFQVTGKAYIRLEGNLKVWEDIEADPILRANLKDLGQLECKVIGRTVVPDGLTYHLNFDVPINVEVKK